MTIIIKAASLLAGVLFASSAQATLIDRGGGLIYDDHLNITWLQDANYAQTSGYTNNNEYLMNWADSVAWADQLIYQGHDGWRLPSTIEVTCAFAFAGSDCGYNVNTGNSELAYMFYINLNNVSTYDTNGNYRDEGGWGLVDDPSLSNDESLFTNLVSGIYWFGTENDANSAWYFNTSTGGQFANSKDYLFKVWAVHDGDVAAAAVPEPETFALFLTGLGLMGFVANRRKAIRQATK